MSPRIIQPTASEVAETAASLTIAILSEAIALRGQAIWVLAGGTAPTAAYQLLATRYADGLDWSKVTLLIGDERCVPAGHTDANWHQIDRIFMSQLTFSPDRLIRPAAELDPKAMAEDYQAALEWLPLSTSGVPKFDLVWLGMGEDGHTLSLFPGHPGVAAPESLVATVYNAPKPPPIRISLTLRALQATSHCLIMATGQGKAAIWQRIAAGDTALPITQAVETIDSHGGSVQWLLDAAAAGLSPEQQ